MKKYVLMEKKIEGVMEGGLNLPYQQFEWVLLNTLGGNYHYCLGFRQL